MSGVNTREGDVLYEAGRFNPIRDHLLNMNDIEGRDELKSKSAADVCFYSLLCSPSSCWRS